MVVFLCLTGIGFGVWGFDVYLKQTGDPLYDADPLAPTYLTARLFAIDMYNVNTTPEPRSPETADGGSVAEADSAEVLPSVVVPWQLWNAGVLWSSDNESRVCGDVCCRSGFNTIKQFNHFGATKKKN